MATRSINTDAKQKIECGIIMPISFTEGYPPTHWNEVRAILLEVLADADYSGDLVSSRDEVNVIQRTIINNLYNNDLVIADVSSKNANVMFELGMRLAFNKPTIIIIDDKTKFTFDIQVIEHLIYPADLNYGAIMDFKVNLKKKLHHTLEASKKDGYSTFLSHFENIKPAHIEDKTVTNDEFLLSRIEAMMDKKLHNITLKSGFEAGVNVPFDTINQFTKSELYQLESAIVKASESLNKSINEVTASEIVDFLPKDFFKFTDFDRFLEGYSLSKRSLIKPELRNVRVVSPRRYAIPKKNQDTSETKQ